MGEIMASIVTIQSTSFRWGARRARASPRHRHRSAPKPPKHRPGGPSFLDDHGLGVLVDTPDANRVFPEVTPMAVGAGAAAANSIEASEPIWVGVEVAATSPEFVLNFSSCNHLEPPHLASNKMGRGGEALLRKVDQCPIRKNSPHRPPDRLLCGEYGPRARAVVLSLDELRPASPSYEGGHGGGGDGDAAREAADDEEDDDEDDNRGGRRKGLTAGHNVGTGCNSSQAPATPTASPRATPPAPPICVSHMDNPRSGVRGGSCRGQRSSHLL
mmetsp:Transcript_88125/g.247867  ORF Transcript_88125/g.247867 Transcript_88125/m.247867 type:complete len:272 (+) Transcript_88125:208-1023(+)